MGVKSEFSVICGFVHGQPLTVKTFKLIINVFVKILLSITIHKLHKGRDVKWRIYLREFYNVKAPLELAVLQDFLQEKLKKSLI